MPDVHDWGAAGEIPKEIYAPAGNAGARALCVGKPWPEQYLGKCPWGYEPDNFHELVLKTRGFCTDRCQNVQKPVGFL